MLDTKVLMARMFTPAAAIAVKASAAQPGRSRKWGP